MKQYDTGSTRTNQPVADMNWLLALFGLLIAGIAGYFLQYTIYSKMDVEVQK